MYTLVVTGGIGTGKSTAAAAFEQLGAARLSADELAHQLMAPGGEAYPEIVEEFGREILGTEEDSEQINRPKLGEIIFAAPEKRAALESILHPKIRSAFKDSRQSLSESANAPELLVYEVPLYYETGGKYDYIDGVLVVALETETARKRVAQSRGISEKQVAARQDAQLPIQDKVSKADYVIWNRGDTKELGTAVTKLYEELLSKSS